jgi:hypothetical protein
MIVHEPTIEERHDEVIVSSKIEFEHSILNCPDNLWFRFPVAQKQFLSESSDGFLTAVLLLAMQYDENIHVRGRVSPRLVAGIDEYQRFFNTWFPNKFRRVKITYDTESGTTRLPADRHVVCAFSGGVDSFFSLWRHLPPNDQETGSRVTHALFVHGFDIEIDDDRTFQGVLQNYRTLFAKLDIPLLTAKTNFQAFGTRSNWGIFHGTALIGLAHILGASIEKFYVPSTHTYRHLVPWGSDPRIDHLLSTETTKIVHDSAEFTRVEKTKAISNWADTYEHLRVCIYGDNLKNCSRCEKCLRTMLTLDLFGALEKYSTFTNPIRPVLIRNCRYKNDSDFTFAREIVGCAFKLKRTDTVVNVLYAIAKSKILNLSTRLARKLFKHRS